MNSKLIRDPPVTAIAICLHTRKNDNQTTDPRIVSQSMHVFFNCGSPAFFHLPRLRTGQSWRTTPRCAPALLVLVY